MVPSDKPFKTLRGNNFLKLVVLLNSTLLLKKNLTSLQIFDITNHFLAGTSLN